MNTIWRDFQNVLLCFIYYIIHREHNKCPSKLCQLLQYFYDPGVFHYNITQTTYIAKKNPIKTKNDLNLKTPNFSFLRNAIFQIF